MKQTVFLLFLVSLQVLLTNCEDDPFNSRKINRSENGHIKSVWDSLNNKRTGECIICSGFSKEKVDTSEIRNYKNGKLHGSCKSFDGNHWVYTTWKNGLKHGVEYEISSDGDYLFLGKWVNDKQVGVHTIYYYKESVVIEFREAIDENDLSNFKSIEMGNRISFQCSFNNEGELNGDCVDFNEFGVLESYGNYKSNKKTGIWLEGMLSENSSKELGIGYYLNDKKNGKWITYKQKFKYQIREYEANESFFLVHRNNIDRKDITEEITYYLGKVIKERYYRYGKVFKTRDELNSFIFSKLTGNSSKQKMKTKKSTYSL